MTLKHLWTCWALKDGNKINVKANYAQVLSQKHNFYKSYMHCGLSQNMYVWWERLMKTINKEENWHHSWTIAWETLTGYVKQKGEVFLEIRPNLP